MELQPTTWEELCVQFNGVLSKNARKITDNKDSAPDLVQETIVRLLSPSTCDFQTVKEPLAYAFRTMKNILIDEFRRAKRAPQHSLDNPNDLGIQNELSYQSTMQIELEYKELLGTIGQRSDRLTAGFSARERELYKLRMIAGKSIKEISIILDEDIRITRIDCYALKAKVRYRTSHWK
ncbi:MAG TPA: RNA polymerase sigma factor [Pyrinomonadaceae bacterium]|nr:RNA polymerase sigma factor [Pyrinomonadaceae bacterium]